MRRRETITNPTIILHVLEKEIGLAPVPEFRFDPPRRWKFDYAWPLFGGGGVALEVEGGVFKTRTFRNKKGRLITVQGGRHNSGTGFLGDMEKYNRATAFLGWKVLRATPQTLLTQATFDMINGAMKL